VYNAILFIDLYREVKMTVSNDFVIIKNNDPCVCGSGKLFKQCCKHKLHKYKSLGNNFKNNLIIFDYTEFINFIPELKYVIQKIMNINDIIEDSIAINILSDLYSALDKALEPIKRVSSCRSGCSYCCVGMFVPTTKIESQLIQEYIEKHLNKNTIDSIMKTITDNKSININLLHDSIKHYEDFNLPCAFLNKDNKCEIYKVRPFTCRKYLLFNDPKDCGIRRAPTLVYHHQYLEEVYSSLLRLNELANPHRKTSMHLHSWFIRAR